MEIQLLGTSAAEGWPGLFCRCEACQKARKLRGKNIRTRASALIDNVLKIDLPPDTLHQVIEHDVELGCVEAVLFTHAHDDHFSPAELQYLGAYFVTPPRSFRLPIYGPPEVTAELERRFDAQTPLERRTLPAWQAADVLDYRVTPIVAQHDPDLTCYNYLVEDADGATLLYASDTGWYDEPTWDFLRTVKIDGMVIECTHGVVKSDYAGHLDFDQVVALRQKLIDCGSFSPEGPVVTTHFSHHGGLMHEELEAVFASYNITPGYDGMRFTVQKV